MKITLPSAWPVACHTDYVGRNSTFVAIKGQKEDGIRYVPLALQKGARTIIAEHAADISPQILDVIKKADAQLMFVANARRSLALLAANAWNNPAAQLKIIAVTGTKGKTTTAWLLHHILQKAGHQTALLSSVKNKINDQEFPTELTTQQPDYLHAFFHTCVQAGVEYVVMEVAAQAFSLHRIAGLTFDGLIFTNFSQAHGEFYPTVDEYFAVKRALFDCVNAGSPMVINADDEKGKELLESFQEALSFSVSESGSMVRYGLRPTHHVCNDIHILSSTQCVSKDTSRSGSFAHIESFGAQGISGILNGLDSAAAFTCPALIGLFNAYNILAAGTMALRLGMPAQDIVAALATFCGVPGRLERHNLPNGAFCFIDFAHNPLSFESVLPLLRSLTNHLILVSGAGGDRDRAMRPVMGRLLAEYADLVFLTTDNPRSENPADIIAAMYAGIDPEKRSRVICEVDREKAIQKAYAASRAGSIVALLGKGPDEYQIFGTIKMPFSERAIVQQLS